MKTRERRKCCITRVTTGQLLSLPDNLVTQKITIFEVWFGSSWELSEIHNTDSTSTELCHDKRCTKYLLFIEETMFCLYSEPLLGPALIVHVKCAMYTQGRSSALGQDETKPKKVGAPEFWWVTKLECRNFLPGRTKSSRTIVSLFLGWFWSQVSLTFPQYILRVKKLRPKMKNI